MLPARSPHELYLHLSITCIWWQWNTAQKRRQAIKRHMKKLEIDLWRRHREISTLTWWDGQHGGGEMRADVRQAGSSPSAPTRHPSSRGSSTCNKTGHTSLSFVTYMEIWFVLAISPLSLRFSQFLLLCIGEVWMLIMAPLYPRFGFCALIAVRCRIDCSTLLFILKIWQLAIAKIKGSWADTLWSQGKAVRGEKKPKLFYIHI